MSEVSEETQVNTAVLFDEKVVDRVRKALVEVLDRGAGDGYIQDRIDQRIRNDVTRLLASDYQIRDAIRNIIKQVITEQMNKY